MDPETLEEEMEVDLKKAGSVDQIKDSMLSNDSLLSCDSMIRNPSLFHLVQDGFQLKNSYEHSKKLTELVDVTYNPRTKQFIFLDTRGITTWYKDGIGHTVHRSMIFPKYQNKLLRNIIYARKYNVYFCLAKDFSLKVLNKDFEETCNIDSDLSSVMFLLFNPVRDELITGGVKGTKVWEFRQVADEVWREIKPMANYKLFLTKELESVKGSWIKKVELNEQFQHIYCCSDTAVQCYDIEGKLVFEIERAHDAQINGCKYSPQARLLITCSNDHEVKVWTLNGGLINVFRGHSKPVTNLVLHPNTSMMVLTASLDGSIKIWSLDIMELIYSVVVSTEGIYWMGLTSEGQLWTATLHDLNLWSINEVVSFYALARCRTTSLHIAKMAHKTSRVVAVGEDSSVRLVSMKDQKNLSTVLPPPSVSPLTQVLSVTYNREYSLVYLLVNPTEIFVYTMKTDPACRTAVWDVMKIQDRTKSRAQSARVDASTPLPMDKKRAPTQRASSAHSRGFQVRSASADGPPGVESASPCHSVLALHSHIQYWADDGFVCPRKTSLLLLGLEDGRILFMDPVNFGEKICELQACKDAILEMERDHHHNTLVIKSHLREEDLVQFWSIPELQLTHEVLVTTDVTQFTRLGSKLFTGHSDGSVKVHELQSVVDDPLAGLRHTGLSLTMIQDESSVGSKDHNGPIVGMDACPERGIFISCSADAVIKVWDCNKTLLTEISLSQTLSTAKILNSKGDLLIGYLNHLFLIDHAKVLPSSDKHLSQSDDTFETESEIYEDPAVKYEGAAANPDPLDLENYLVPFNLDLTQRFLAGEGTGSDSDRSSHVDNDLDSESEFSQAATEVYQSPVATPRRLSMVDMLVSSDAINKQAIKENKEVYSLRRRQMSRRHSFHTTREGRVGNFEFPMFGRSPGPSPTPTPPSSLSDASISDISSETEEDEADEIEVESVPIVLPTKEYVPVTEKKPVSKPVKPAPVEAKEEEPRYGLSTMKIDSKALLSLRNAPSSATTRKVAAPSSQVSLDEGGEKPRSRPSTSKAPIKKKEQKKNRTRVGQRSSEDGEGRGSRGVTTGVGGEGLSQPAKVGASTPASGKQISSKTSTKDSLQGSTVGMSLVQLEGPEGKGASGAPNVGNRGKKLVVREKKKKKQPIFARDGKTSQGSAVKTESDSTNGTQDAMASEGQSDIEGKAETVEKSRAPTESSPGPGAMAMFKAANKLHISQKYGPEQAKIAITHQAEETERAMDEDLDDDEVRQSPIIDGGHSIDHPAVTEYDGDDGGDARDTVEDEGVVEDQGITTEHDEMEEDGNIGDDVIVEEDVKNETIGRSCITSGRSMSAKEGRVRFDIPLKRAQSAAPRLAGEGDHRKGMPHPSFENINDAESMLSSIVRTNSEEELANIPESTHSIFDDADFDNSPTPPNISVSIMSKTSTRQTSLPDSRIGSGLSRFEMDSPYSPMRLPFSPLAAQSPLGERFLDEGGRGSVMEEVNSFSDVAPVNYNRAIPFSAPPEGRRARPNTAERRREEQPRPHTAGTDALVTFQDEDFGSMTEEEFQRHLDFVSTPTDLSGYLKNDGLQLDKNWTDRMIQRHQFLKMQKEQRAKSAADRRQLLDLRQRQRRKALLGHRQCAEQSGVYQKEHLSQSDPSLNANRTNRAKSAPAHGTRQHSSQSQDTTGSPRSQRRQTFFSRKTDDLPSTWRQENTPSPSLGTKQALEACSCGHQDPPRPDPHPMINGSLPPSGHPSGQMSSWNPHHHPNHSSHRCGSPGRGRPMPQMTNERRCPVGQAGVQMSNQRSGQQSDKQMDQSRTRSDLAAEKPYRFRFNKSKSTEGVLRDTVTRNSTTNKLVVKKKQSAKSIPSKARRYVLVHQPGTDPGVLMPSSLEEQLLAKRFPKMHQRWQRMAPPPPADIEGIPPPPQRKNSLNPTFVNPLPYSQDGSPSLI